MNYMIKFGLIGYSLLLLLSCQAKQTASAVSSEVKQDTVLSRPQFPFPEIPATLTEPEARKSYLLTHYWERFDFADTTLVDNRDVTEQGFVNFIALLVDGTTSEELTRESLKNWCTGFIAKDHARRVLMKTADDYLYNPNSPFYNEGLYGVYLETLLDVVSDGRCTTLHLQLPAEVSEAQQSGRPGNGLHLLPARWTACCWCFTTRNVSRATPYWDR